MSRKAYEQLAKHSLVYSWPFVAHTCERSTCFVRTMRIHNLNTGCIGEWLGVWVCAWYRIRVIPLFACNALCGTATTHLRTHLPLAALFSSVQRDQQNGWVVARGWSKSESCIPVDSVADTCSLCQVQAAGRAQRVGAAASTPLHKRSTRLLGVSRCEIFNAVGNLCVYGSG